MNTIEKLNRLADMQAQAESIRAQFAEIRDRILSPEIKAQLADVDAEERTKIEPLQEAIDALTTEENLGGLVRFTQIAKELAELRQLLFHTQEEAIDKETTLKLRQFDLTPAEGWPGKNAEERKAAQERAFKDDEMLSGLETMLETYRYQSRKMAMQITVLEDERRGLEWEARFQLNGYREIPY
jgi:chromosome segregation ATPase